MTTHRVVQCIGAVLLVSSAACSGAPANLEVEDLGEQRENLWLAAEAQKWPNVDIPVCFAPCVSGPLFNCTEFFASDKQFIQDAISNSWGSFSVSPNTNFTGWGTCPSPIPAGRIAVRVNTELGVAALGRTSVFGHSATSPTFVEFPFPGHLLPYPDDSQFRAPNKKTVIHEFGHALGFAHEHKDDDTCDQRTSGGTQLTPWDEPNSIMSQTGCNGFNATLSANDILGIEKAYARDTDGSSSIRTYNTDPNNLEGDATHSGNLLKCKNNDEVLVGIEQWAWNSHTIQCARMSGTWAGDFAGRRYAYSDPSLIRSGVASCPWGYVAIGVDFSLNRLYCSAARSYQGNGYVSNSGKYRNFKYHGIDSEIHICPTGALQGANVSFGVPTAGQGYNFNCVNP